MKKISFKLSNFHLDNTPELAKKIGNFGLLVAGIGALIIGAPETMAASGLVGFQLPSFALNVAHATIGIGALLKLLSKLLGVLGGETAVEQPKQ